MNTCEFDGYLPADAEEAWIPASGGVPARPKLVFRIVLRDGRGVEIPTACAVDDPELMGQYRALLTSGRWVVCHGEQSAYPRTHHGVFQGLVPQVRVLRMEFPGRVSGGKAAVAAGGHADTVESNG